MFCCQHSTGIAAERLPNSFTEGAGNFPPEQRRFLNIETAGKLGGDHTRSSRACEGIRTLLTDGFRLA